jgi:hypothetical protein
MWPRIASTVACAARQMVRLIVAVLEKLHRGIRRAAHVIALAVEGQNKPLTHGFT